MAAVRCSGGRRSAVTALALLALLDAAAAGAKKRKSETVHQEPLTTGDCRGPFAAALGADGRAHLVYTRREADNASRLVYRCESTGRGWEPAETVLLRGVDQVALAVGPAGPVVGFVAEGVGHLALRGESGWWAVATIGAEQSPSALALSVLGSTVRAVFAGRLPASEDAFLRRVAVHGTEPRPPADATLPAGRGPVISLAMAPVSDTTDEVAFVRRMPTSKIRIFGGNDPDLSVRTLSYARLDHRLGRPTDLWAEGSPTLITLSPRSGSAIVVWTARGQDSTRIIAQRLGFDAVGTDELLNSESPVAALAAAGLGRLVFVTAVFGPLPRSPRGRWLDGDRWSNWQLPPGLIEGAAGDTVAVSAVLGATRLARVFVQARDTLADDAPQRITEWVFVPGARY